jgi:UDP-N-acetylmuramoyl-L-alanyl-D-glutamate--2,6-diaminopimelate ligase
MHLTQLCQGPVSLRETLTKAQFLKAADVVASSCSADWRACQPGDVFFAVTTADDDGHEHAAEALAAGASAVVAERLLPIETPQILVRDTRVAFARVCQALAGNPSRQLKTIGVTGTAGKTVTAMLIASVFEAAGETAGVMSSMGHSDSVVQRAATSSTPTAPEFASWLARMAKAGCEAGVIEVSSRALAEHRASGMELDAAVLTNIQSEHLDEHNSARAYQQIKRRIFKLLKTGGVAVVNADDHRCRNLVGELSAPCLTYALHAEADVTAQVLERCPSEQTFLLTAGSDSAPVRTRMIGDHHVSNCLAAAAVGLSLGIDWQAIIRGIEAVERVPCRMERLECGQPFSVFVDAAGSPESLALAMKTARQVTAGRLLAVFGPRAETDGAKKALLGRVLERGAHVPIITSRVGREPELLRMAHDVLDGFNKPQKAQVIPDRAAAIRFALSQARADDCVLIAGRDEARSDIGGRRMMKDDDREVACQWLYAQGEPSLVRPRFRVVGR